MYDNLSLGTDNPSFKKLPDSPPLLGRTIYDDCGCAFLGKVENVHNGVGATHIGVLSRWFGIVVKCGEKV